MTKERKRGKPEDKVSEAERQRDTSGKSGVKSGGGHWKHRHLVMATITRSMLQGESW